MTQAETAGVNITSNSIKVYAHDSPDTELLLEQYTLGDRDEELVDVDSMPLHAKDWLDQAKKQVSRLIATMELVKQVAARKKEEDERRLEEERDKKKKEAKQKKERQRLASNSARASNSR